MENMLIKAEIDVNVTAEDVDDIMCAALEGGITYWCDEARVAGEYLGTYGHEQIARGGQLILHDMEADGSYILDLAKLKNGIRMYVEEGQPCGDILEATGNDDKPVHRISTFDVDAAVADAIVQLAMFGEIIYG